LVVERVVVFVFVDGQERLRPGRASMPYYISRSVDDRLRNVIVDWFLLLDVNRDASM
jgi:hypothetical protein